MLSYLFLSFALLCVAVKAFNLKRIGAISIISLATSSFPAMSAFADDSSMRFGEFVALLEAGSVQAVGT